MAADSTKSKRKLFRARKLADLGVACTDPTRCRVSIIPRFPRTQSVFQKNIAIPPIFFLSRIACTEVHTRQEVTYFAVLACPFLCVGGRWGSQHFSGRRAPILILASARDRALREALAKDRPEWIRLPVRSPALRRIPHPGNPTIHCSTSIRWS